jgi:hypothetical protein
MSLISSSAKITGATSFYDYPIEQSLRFDGSSYLSRTPTTAGNRRTWTFSFWVKRTRTETDYIFGVRASNAASNIAEFQCGFRVDLFRIIDTSPRTVLYDAAGKIRDLSSWYHYVIKWDTTEALNTDRIKIYKNGKLQISTSEQDATVYPGSSVDITAFNSQIEHSIGRVHYYGGTNYTPIYLANIQFIDGQALDASYFGETKQDIWVPKTFDGTSSTGGSTVSTDYGTNGFLLDFSSISGTTINDTAPIDTNHSSANNWTATGF